MHPSFSSGGNVGVVSQHHQLLFGNGCEKCHAVGFCMIVVVIVWKFAFCLWFKTPFPIYTPTTTCLSPDAWEKRDDRQKHLEVGMHRPVFSRRAP